MPYSKDQCTEIIKDAILKSQNGLSVEYTKFDFKAKWYDLNNEKQQNDFIKDSSAMANTFGLDGLIVIGFDEKSKEFHQTKFAYSGYNDTSRIYSLLSKRLSVPFAIDIWDESIDGNNLSVIHIPPSLEKPHVILADKKFDKDGTQSGKEDQRIYVRHGSTNRLATSYDLELMFYDRKNIIPEYSIESYIKLNHGFAVNPVRMADDHFRFKVPVNFIFENIGRRPVMIDRIGLILDNGSSVAEDAIYLSPGFDESFQGLSIVPGGLMQKTVLLSTKVEKRVWISDEKSWPFAYHRFLKAPHTYSSDSVTLHLHNGTVIESKLTILRM